MRTEDKDDGFGPYLCLTTKHACNPARDHCRCWWISENPEHWRQLVAIKLAADRPDMNVSAVSEEKP